MENNEQTQNRMSLQTMIIPIAIIIAGALIAGGIYMTGTAQKGTVPGLGATKANIVVEPVTTADHVLGDPKTAKVTIIEYSDLECPVCKMYYSTLTRIFDDYKASGKVAWVYRHSPIIELHSKAPKEAEATECAAELGGNDIFWKYKGELLNNTPSNNGLNLSKLYEFADTVGLNAKAFKTCLDSGKYATKINEQTEAARKAGVDGTPYTILVMDGKNVPLIDKNGIGIGAVPYAQMKQIIDQLVK